MTNSIGVSTWTSCKQPHCYMCPMVTNSTSCLVVAPIARHLRRVCLRSGSFPSGGMEGQYISNAGPIPCIKFRVPNSVYPEFAMLPILKSVGMS